MESLLYFELNLFTRLQTIVIFRIIERNGGKAPLTYHQFQALIASMPPPPPAEVTITPQMLNGATTPITDNHDDRFGVPTLEELGKFIDSLIYEKYIFFTNSL